MTRLHHIAIAGVTLFMLSATGAKAELFSSCSLKETKDGFVALRDAPSPSGNLIVKMRNPGFVSVDVKNGDFVERKGWVRVSYWPTGDGMPNPGDPGYEKVRHGWMNDALIDGCG